MHNCSENVYYNQSKYQFMKYLILLIATILMTLVACGPEQEAASDDHAHHQPSSEGSVASPRKMAMANIGDVHVHIDYSSPSVRGRTIWGGLVGYDQVWVAGAHSATSIDFNKDVRINGKVIEAGKYAFFVIPGREEWTLIINKNYQQHLADDYDAALDVMRIAAVPRALEDQVEALTYSVTPQSDNAGTVALSWDNLGVSFVVEALL